MADKSNDGNAARKAAAPSGDRAKAPAQSAPESREKAAKRGKMVAASFGEIVVLMAHTPALAERPLKDLDWLVAPPIALGQYLVIRSEVKKNVVAPVAAALWAFVSEEVDQRLSAQKEGLMRLEFKEWRSGKIPWVIEVLGERRAVSNLLGRLATTVFKDRPAKMRVVDNKGVTRIGLLKPAAVKPTGKGAQS